MPDQTVKHDNSLPGFLLILLPAAFVAVFLSVAWPFILGGVLLLTGNSVWQSYQWAKLSQQVNPYFSQMVLEQQGEIAPFALSARANISAPVADRYLQGKAAEIGGVSYQTPNGGTIYSFLTVGSLENTFAGLNPNPSISEKLAELELPTAVTKEAAVTPPIETLTVQPIVAPVPEQQISGVEVNPIATPPVATMAPTVAKVVEVELPASAPAIQEIQEVVAPKVTEPVQSTKVVVAATPIVETPAVVETINNNATGSSDFAQALRNIFTSDNPEPVLEEPMELEQAAVETISQTDLAKRLDVHPSTLYKRRADVSFAEWTRNRDPEGIAWGYQRDTKEFYRTT
jgi:hypothetical protein